MNWNRPCTKPEKQGWGAHPPSGVAGRATRPAFFMHDVFTNVDLFYALDVFREGAENGTRGARSPHLNFGFRANAFCPGVELTHRSFSKLDKAARTWILTTDS